MNQLSIGPPSKPLTPLNSDGLKRIADRLSLVLDTTGFDDSMAPAVKNTVETIITQDVPALLAYVINNTRPICSCECQGCRMIHGGKPEAIQETRIR